MKLANASVFLEAVRTHPEKFQELTSIADAQELDEWLAGYGYNFSSRELKKVMLCDSILSAGGQQDDELSLDVREPSDPPRPGRPLPASEKHLFPYMDYESS